MAWRNGLTKNSDIFWSEVKLIENFLSDVGGTAGLMLGMSFATVIGLIDILLQQSVKFGRQIVGNFFNIVRSKESDVSLLKTNRFFQNYNFRFCRHRPTIQLQCEKSILESYFQMVSSENVLSDNQVNIIY